MAKDYAKFVPPKPRRQYHRTWRLPLIIALFLVMFCFAGVTYVKYAKSTPDAFAANPKVTALLEKVVNLFTVHKKAPASEPKKAAILAKHDGPPPVQFDFYNELPAMQVALPEPATPAQPVAKPEVKTTPPAPIAIAQAVPAPIESKAIVINADDVSSLLAEEARSAEYILQLGVFDTQVAAKRLTTALVDVGFQTDITKLKKGGHVIYRVQQGPYASLSLAKSTQQRLQKRGIISSIQKT